MLDWRNNQEGERERGEKARCSEGGNAAPPFLAPSISPPEHAKTDFTAAICITYFTTLLLRLTGRQ